MNIDIQVIPHNEQRYDTVGDWFFTKDWYRPKGTEMGPQKLWTPIDLLHIRVSKMSDWRYEVLVGLHELVECLICRQQGVSQQAVDNFDMAWQQHADIAEPGDDPTAPYYQQHQLASVVERLVSLALGVYWPAYEDEVMSLSQEK